MITAVVLFCFLEPPKFTHTPARVSVVRPGQSKVFECQVTGTPEIDMYWFKEGSEISPSDRYKMAFVNSVATLEVCGAETKDSGLYYCEARNEAGSESCSMELKVKGWLCQFKEFRMRLVNDFPNTREAISPNLSAILFRRAALA